MQSIDKVTLDRAVLAVKAMWHDVCPRLGIVLGSGWGEAVEGFAVKASMPFTDIIGLGRAEVAGHAGRILRAEFCGEEVMIFQGRRHLYEGAGMTPVVLPIWLLKQLGAHSVLLTNASGGIRDDLRPGSLMVLGDHINMLGENPLRGTHVPAFGVRFPDQTAVYAPALRQKLIDAGADAEGVYVATVGPTFETPAEIRAFRSMGADVVGMSTVPEAMFANAMGMQVAGLSCVCNWAAGLGHEKLTHEDVSLAAAQAMPRMRAVIEEFTKGMVCAY